MDDSSSTYLDSTSSSSSSEYFLGNFYPAYYYQPYINRQLINTTQIKNYNLKEFFDLYNETMNIMYDRIIKVRNEYNKSTISIKMPIIDKYENIIPPNNNYNFLLNNETNSMLELMVDKAQKTYQKYSFILDNKSLDKLLAMYNKFKYDLNI